MSSAHHAGVTSNETRPDAPRGGRAVSCQRLSYLLLAVWLAASPFIFAGPSQLVAAKDLGVAVALLLVAAAAALTERGKRLESVALIVLGGLLITASVAVEFGAGAEAAARQWNEVIVGVLLICIAAVRPR